MHGSAAEARLLPCPILRKPSHRQENPGTDDHSTTGSLDDLAASVQNAGLRATRRIHIEKETS
jgi:hypothetical protein